MTLPLSILFTLRLNLKPCHSLRNEVLVGNGRGDVTQDLVINAGETSSIQLSSVLGFNAEDIHSDGWRLGGTAATIIDEAQHLRHRRGVEVAFVMGVRVGIQGVFRIGGPRVGFTDRRDCFDALS